MCSSPRLIAAYHDLHRLSMPRHPPCALLRLISNSFELRGLTHAPVNGYPPTSQPVLIPHTRLRSSCGERQTTTIHPSVVKEPIGPRRGR
jgi:hypothetical protein